MKYNRLGHTGIKVSMLGLGTVKIGRNQKVKYPGGDGFRIPDDKEVEKLLDTAISLDINLIDTAPAYGTSEERLGKLLGSNREKFVIITKAGEEFENGVSDYNFTSGHIRTSVERSLKRLKTDRIESVLLHCHRNDSDIIENTPALETLHDLKEKGDILSYGVSGYTVDAGLKSVEMSDVVMVTYNIQETQMLPVIDYAHKSGKGVLIKKGLLSGNIPAHNNKDPIGMCMRSIFSVPGITSLITGSLNPEHLKENARHSIS